MASCQRRHYFTYNMDNDPEFRQITGMCHHQHITFTVKILAFIHIIYPKILLFLKEVVPIHFTLFT